MTLPDVVNGTFEFAGGFFLFRNCSLLYRDKVVRGVSVITTAFFMTWGYWNLFYYSSLEQWFSLSGGVLLVLANTLWVCMAIYYGVVNGRDNKAV